MSEFEKLMRDMEILKIEIQIEQKKREAYKLMEEMQTLQNELDKLQGNK